MAEGLVCLLVKAELVGAHLLIIYPCCVEAGNILQILLGQKLLFLQKLRANQQRLSGKHGIALVGGIAVGGNGNQREDLPEMLPRGFQKVNKFVGTFSKIPDSVGGRKGSGVQ